MSSIASTPAAQRHAQSDFQIRTARRLIGARLEWARTDRALEKHRKAAAKLEPLVDMRECEHNRALPDYLALTFREAPTDKVEAADDSLFARLPSQTWRPRS